MKKRLKGYPWMPSKWAGLRGSFRADPVAIVLHSGARSPNVAEWFSSKWNKRKAWTMFAWSGELGREVQCDDLDQTTSHVGEWWNDFAIGIEYPGPWHLNPRPQRQHDQVVELCNKLIETYPTICMITAHSAITRSKKDPGPGVTAEKFYRMPQWEGVRLVGF